MTTAAQEAASPIALRDCSKAAVGESLRFWWRGSSIPWSTQFTKGFLLVMRVWCHHERIQSMGLQRVGHHWATSLSLSRYKEMQGLTTYNLFLKTSNYLKTCPTRFPGAQTASLDPELPQGLLKVNSYRGRWQSTSLFSPWHAFGKCQFVVHTVPLWS